MAAVLLAEGAPEQVVSAVLVCRSDDLVAGLQFQRTGDEVHRRRRVRNEDEVGRGCADVRGEPLPRRRDQLRVAASEAEKLDRLALELPLESLVLLADRPWAGAVRAVIEEDDVRIEQEQVSH